MRLVAVDGHAGSGKSTFAGLLAERLGGAPVLHLDDIARHDELFGWTARLHDEVIGPLSRGETAHYAPTTGAPAAPDRRVRCPPRRWCWSRASARDARRCGRIWRCCCGWTCRGRSPGRGRARDGEEQREFWDGWEPAERAHFADDPSRPFAHLLVRQRQQGYEVVPGPAGTGEAPRSLTHGDWS